MVHKRELHLMERERAVLIEHRDHDPRPQVRERCAALLKVADGQSAYGVACHGLLKARDPDSVYQWLDIYEKEGVNGLLARLHGGAHRKRP